MNSATCPRCGTTIYSTVLGQAWLACQTCQYFGMLLTTPMPSLPAPTQVMAHAATPTPTPTLAPAPTAEESQLWALQQQALRYGEDIAAELGALATPDFRLPLTQVWDRMQQATDALFRSLGERRMGDYPPDMESVARALSRIGAWHVIALQAAGRLHEPGERA